MKPGSFLVKIRDKHMVCRRTFVIHGYETPEREFMGPGGPPSFGEWSGRVRCLAAFGADWMSAGGAFRGRHGPPVMLVGGLPEIDSLERPLTAEWEKLA